MLGYFALGTLASFGLLSLLWALFGWLLPGPKGGVFVFYREPQPEIFARIKWLRSLGLMDSPVIILGPPAQSPWEAAENCTEEALLLRLKQEYDRYYGTGTGNSPGRDQRCGLSEL